MKLRDLFLKREELNRRLHARLSARDQAMQALRILDQLKAELPALISEVKASKDCPIINTQCSADDGIDRDFVRRYEAVEAGEKLLAELPAIRAHWARQLDLALKAMGQQPAKAA